MHPTDGAGIPVNVQALIKKYDVNKSGTFDTPDLARMQARVEALSARGGRVGLKEILSDLTTLKVYFHVSDPQGAHPPAGLDARLQHALAKYDTDLIDHLSGD